MEDYCSKFNPLNPYTPSNQMHGFNVHSRNAFEVSLPFFVRPIFLGGQTPQPKTQISFSDKRESHRGATTLPQGILLNFLVKIFFLVGLHLFLSPFFLPIWISSPLPCFMPFSLLCCCFYPFCVSLSSCFGIFFLLTVSSLLYSFLSTFLALFSFIEVQFHAIFSSSSLTFLRVYCAISIICDFTEFHCVPTHRHTRISSICTSNYFTVMVRKQS